MLASSMQRRGQLKKRSLFLLATSTFVLLTAMTMALAGEPEKEASVIQLQNAPACLIMQELGLVSETDMDDGKAPVWQRVCGPASDLVPAGIDLVAPYEPDDTLIVYGNGASIDELRETVQLLDVKPKRITVKAEVFRLTAEQTKQLNLTWPDGNTENTPGIVLSTNTMAEAFRDQLKQLGAQPINSPIFSTLNELAATISIGSTTPDGVEVGSSLTIRPRVNADSTITITLKWTEKTCRDNAPRQQSIYTRRRLAVGESIVTSLPGENGTVILLFATPKVAE